MTHSIVHTPLTDIYIDISEMGKIYQLSGIIIYIPLSRVGKGWEVNIRECEGWNKHEKVEKPHGKMKFLIFIFHHVQPLKKVYM